MFSARLWNLDVDGVNYANLSVRCWPIGFGSGAWLPNRSVLMGLFLNESKLLQVLPQMLAAQPSLEPLALIRLMFFRGTDRGGSSVDRQYIQLQRKGGAQKTWNLVDQQR